MGGLGGLTLPPKLDRLLSGGPIALFLDFDGTLVELAKTPDAIDVPHDLGERIELLYDRLEGRLALVSGRSLEDLEKHIGSIGVPRAGSHGAARQWADGSWLGDEPVGLAEAVTEAMQDYARREGIDYERKTHGGALHFRAAPEREAAAIGFAATLADEHGLELKTGKSVVEIVRTGADKGQAVAAFMREEPFAGSRPWFIGDDVTDEDGFAASMRLGGRGILVGDRAETRADYRLPNVKDVHKWLDL